MNLKKINPINILRKRKKEKKIIKNVYKTKYDKNVLICYITHPFTQKNKPMSHTNIEMARIVAKVFFTHGYNVDVVNFNENKEICLNKYDVAFGWGKNFDNAIYDKNIFTITFLTEAGAYYSSISELKRVEEARKRVGRTFELRRRKIYDVSNLELVKKTDVAICHGNRWTLGTWDGLYEKTYLIDGFGFNTGGFIKRNLQQTRRNFFFMSGSGNIHKGLDLCLEAFRELPDYCLYIATKLDKDFEEHYQEDLKRENVYYVGFVNVDSDIYKDIVQKCLFSILPSCSEGMATSVLTTMESGLIPIVTEQCGVDLNETGFLIEDISVQGIRNIIQNASAYDDEKLFYMSEKASKLVDTRYNVIAFEKRFDEILTEIENSFFYTT